jgi:hypothetical protein
VMCVAGFTSPPRRLVDTFRLGSLGHGTHEPMKCEIFTIGGVKWMNAPRRTDLLVNWE